MKRFLIAIASMFFGVAIGNSAYAECTADQIDVLGDGTQCEPVHFTLGTTSNTNKLSFIMTAEGDFYVDCGNGGTLTSSASDVTNNTTITRRNRESATYTCTWGTAYTQSVRFGGTAKAYHAYSTTADYPAIGFYKSSGGTQGKIASVSGNMSAMFPYQSSAPETYQPRFETTFQGATNLTSIDANLFSDYTTASKGMFYSTFADCTGLTSIPENLFFPNAQSVTGQESMFSTTFANCTGLTSIPRNLFAKITSSALNMFKRTFYGCSNLQGGYIPKSTFVGLIDAGSPTANGMWTDTFTGTKMLRSCPSGRDTVETTYQGTNSGTQWGDYVMCDDKPTNNIPTSQSYVDAGVDGLQNKFAGLGANKLMTYPTGTGGTPGSRDIVTTLGTPDATTGVYSNTTDTTIPTTGAVKTGVNAKQNKVNGTADYVMTGTGTAGTVGQKAVYGNTTQFNDALIEVGTVNSAIVDAVNSELTQVDENDTPSATGLFWRVNNVANIVTLPVSGN